PVPSAQPQRPPAGARPVRPRAAAQRDDLLPGRDQARGGAPGRLDAASGRLPLHRPLGEPERTRLGPGDGAAGRVPEAGVISRLGGSLDVFLQPGEFYFGEAGTVIRTTLGSCVAI